jgi:hypothetical protein
MGKRITNHYTKEDPINEYKAVKQYLLTDSPMFGDNKPKLWIHSKYEVNARKWRDFGSRNTTDLNQPYLHLTVQSIIHHCSEDFHILMIDDESFGKLLDDWDVNLSLISEPEKEHWRQFALSKLILKYGGMIVPNSYVCIQSLKEMWNNATTTNNPFIAESINNTGSVVLKSKFIPDMYFLGCKDPQSPHMFEFSQFMHKRCTSITNISSMEGEFLGDVQNWLAIAHHRGIFKVLPGEYIGIKNRKHQPILIENWMEQADVNLSDECFGIYIPADEILKRPKYKWFAVMNTEDILNSNMIISRYIRKATAESIHTNPTYEPQVQISKVGGI